MTQTQASSELANRIVIKGQKDGVLVNLSEAGTWAEVSGALVAQIDAQPAFFQGGRLTVEVGAREVRASGLSALRAARSERQVSLWGLVSANPRTNQAAKLLGMENPPEPIDGYEELEPIDTEIMGSAGILVRQTLRSGITVHHTGHVVVVGDVNPGAQVVAGGDVVVWGRLRGMVHAGAYGDETAVVCALDLSPMQLRIAGHIAISPPNEKRRSPKPEEASVQRGQIVATLWKPGR